MSERARKYLDDLHWPVGLQECALKTLKTFPLRFVVIDNSGSMVRLNNYMFSICLFLVCRLLQMVIE